MADKHWWEEEYQTNQGTQSQNKRWWEESDDTLSTVGNNITKRVNTWLQNHNNYITNYQNRYADRKFSYEDSYVSDPNDWQIKVNKQKSAFDAEADSILSYLDYYKGSFDSEWVKSIRDTLTSARNQQQTVIDDAVADSNWWRNFANEDEYKTAQRYDSYSKKYSGQKYDSIQQALNTLEDGEEKNWLSQYQYDLYQNDSNYTSKATSGLKSFEAQKVAEQEKEADKGWWERYAELYAQASLSMESPLAASIGSVQDYYRNDTSWREPNDNWSEGEKKQFGYLYAEDPNKAYQYAEQVNGQINAAITDQQQQAVGEAASNNAVLGTLGAIATAPLAMGDVVNDLLEYSTRGTITQKDYLSPFEMGQAAQSGIATKLNEHGTIDENVPVFGGKGWGDVYSLGVSAANSLLSAYTLGGTGTLVNFIGQGGAAGVDDALSRGATPEQALLYGSIVGAAEGLTELFSADKLINVGSASTLKNWLKAALAQGIGETVEEGASSVIGNIADNIIMADKSNFNRMVQELMAQGMSEEEAKSKAWTRMVGDVVFDAMGGFVTGSTNAMTVGGAQTAANAWKGNEANIEAVKQYGEHTDELIQEGLQSDKKSESYQLAQKYQQQVKGKDGKDGKALSGFQIRNLVDANEAQFQVENYNEALLKAKERLTALGETKNVKKVADLVAKFVSGQKLEKSEKSYLTRSQYGEQVAKEMIEATQQTHSADRGYDTTYKSITDRVGTEGRFNVSESGNAIIRGTEENFDIKKAEVVEVGEGQVTFETANGTKVSAGHIDFADDSESFLVSAVSDIENITPAAATAVLHDIVDTSKPLNAQLNGIDEAYTYGFHGYSVADLKAGVYVTNLTSQQMMSAYELGKSARKISDVNADTPRVKMRTAAEATVSETEKVAQQKARFESDDVEVYFEDGGNVVKFDEHSHKYDEKRMAGVNTAKFLSKMGIGSKFYFYESYEKDGKRVYKNENGEEVNAPNGIYRTADGSIHIDLNAGETGEGTTLFTLGHELTHFIKDYSRKQFKTLADLVTEAYSKTDMSMHERVVQEQDRLSKARGEHVTYDEAFEEVVANAMSTMLTDGNLHEKLAEIKAKDKGLFDSIKKFFDKLISRFRSLYAKLTPDQKDAQDIRQMKDMFDRIQNAFAEALVEASENYQASITAEESQTLNEAGIGFDEETKTVYSVRYSTAYVDTIQVGKKSFDTEALAQIVAKGTGRSIEDARKWVNSEMSIANMVLANPEFLDFEADNRYEAIKKNSDYPQGTVDLSNLCPKREEFTNMFDRLQKEYPDRLFTAQDIADMRKILAKNNITVACGACFVEDRRQLIGEIADTYIQMWREAVETGKPLQKTNAAGQKSDLLVTKALAKQYGLTSGAKIMATDTYIPNQYDLTTYEGFKLLEKNHPTIAMGFNRYNNSRGQQSARLIEGRAEYNRQILGWSDAKVRSVNNNGGLRIFSFSDFEVVHLLDLVQVIIDCSARGVKIQGYTKIPAFAKLVRDTGIKLNRSLIPKGDYGFHMEGDKVVLDYDTTEGIDINDENFLDESDNPNVGNIVIGINPTQIGAAMLDPFVDYIIPFHSNKAKEILKKLGTGTWVNYKESQHEKDISTGKASKHNVNIYTEVINKYHPKNKVEFVEAFLTECKRQGKIPRYAEFLNVDANGNYTYREGYHKLLVDFKMFDKEGNILPQGNITPNLNEGFMKDLLNAEVDKKQNYKFPQAVYDDINKKFGEKAVEVQDKDKGDRFSYRGKNADGIEVYETSQDVKNLTRKERQKQFLDIMANEYRGRTAKFIRNGHAYYATFDEKDVNKNIYGDKRSDKKGYRAKINVGADGDIFELVENAKYDGSKPEKGKKITAHNGVGYWDYFIKNVQIDGTVFDLVANVRRKADGDYVYSIQLNENKKIKASPPLGLLLKASNGVTNAFNVVEGAGTSAATTTTNNVAQPTPKVNKNSDRNSERTGESVSNRSLLANAFEGISQNSNEYKLIQQYKSHIAELNSLEDKLSDFNREIRRIRFGKGEYDAEKLARLEDAAGKIVEAITKHDKRLISLEASEPLRKLLERERKKEAQKTKEHVAEIQQNRKLKAEQIELRHKIRKAVRDLDKLLNRGNKKLNVKEDLQPVVAKALKAADILFTDSYNSLDMLRNGIEVAMTDSEEALVASCAKLLKQIDSMPSDGYDSWQARQKLEEKLRAKMSKLKDVFVRERKRLNNTTVSSILGDLADAYGSLEKSDQSYVQGAYTEAVHNFLKNLQSEVGGTIVSDMTKNQLESVYAAYQMVLNTVRNANKMFNEELKQSREQLGNAVINEVISAGGTHGLWTKGEAAMNQALWNNMKPVWVANRIGSDTFGKLMDGLFKGQYNFAVDVDEAKQFKLEMDEKYHPRTWDTEKLHSFESATGKPFELSLQQIMSLYAFSKREQAYSHLLNGGFVYEANSTVIVDEKGVKRTYLRDGATSYKLNEVTLGEIINTLTAEQKAYVDEMQKYLSEVMGAKGNEVSMKLYGIQMFKEKFYFPLRSSGAYLERAKEAELKKQQGQINLVNSGFTHAVKPEAKNPIVLAGFLDAWSEHCNEMSMYHSMVLPMEDFRKVYNYSTVHDDKLDSASVFQSIQDAYGKAATDYIDQLYRELNAGATIDPRETAFKARISQFKKAATMLSASVVVQQFSSVGRAFAVIDPKYFVGRKIESGTKMTAAEEMKKYAPVAIIKEMGGFDTGTKGSAKSYIMAEQYGKGERIEGFRKDEQFRSDVMGFLPAKADELTWSTIWEAAKRETKATHQDMDVKSEKFLKLAGERFSEIIEKTQVYDSVLARSANMRSKSGLMQMATAFMAEPTTTVNLLEDAVRSGKAKHIARAFGAVAVSIVLNNALSSVIYAMRDDDEDETFIEKYFQSFASSMIDDINPMSYYPFLKDMYSLFQGYDVERADMSVIADLRDAMKKAISVIGKDTSEMDDDELAEHWKNVNGVMLSILDAGCSMFGVPVKNVRRDAMGIVNAFNTIGKDVSGERETTWNSFWDKVGAAAKDTIPIYAWMKDKPKAEKLYDAIMSGGKAYLGRLKATYKTESAYQNAVRKVLRENDQRIHEAAQAKYDGNLAEYKRLFREIQNEGRFSFDDIMNAVNSELSEIKSGQKTEEVSSDYSSTDFVNALLLGENRTAESMREDIISAKVANGKTLEEAKESFADSVYTSVKNSFDSGLLDEAGAEKLLTEYSGRDAEEAAAKVSYWSFVKAHKEYKDDLSEEKVAKFHEFAEPADISLDVFVQFLRGTKDLGTIYDEWGDEVKSKREQVLEVIDSLPLTWQQKDALYLAAGYAESKIWDVPW